jgi:hypothetical protein
MLKTVRVYVIATVSAPLAEAASSTTAQAYASDIGWD